MKNLLFARAILFPAIFLAALLAQSCTTTSGYPLTYHYGTPWATASVNGVEGIFLLDTGASVTVLDVEMAKRAELRPFEEHEILGTSGSVLARTGWANSVSLGGKTHYDRLVSIQDLAGFRAPGGRQQSGLVGCDFFLDYTVVFDLEDSHFELLRESAPIKENMVQHPMVMFGGTPMIYVFFPPMAEPVLARLDSGSGYADEGTVYLDMTRETARRLIGSRLDQPPDGQAKVRSITGTDTLDIYNYGPVRVLGKTLNEVRVVVRNHSVGAFADEDTILITGSLLRQFGRMELDFPRRSIWVPPSR